MNGLQENQTLDNALIVNPSTGIDQGSTKFCKWCQKTKLLSDFSTHRNKCKACVNEHAREYRKNNPEKLKKIWKTSRTKNKEKVLLATANWRLRNIDKVLEYSREYGKVNNEKKKDYNKKYYQDNLESEKERHRAYANLHQEERNIINKKWNKNNPGKKALYNKKSYDKNPASKKSAARRREAKLKGAVILEKFKFVEICERDGWICQICKLPVDKTLKHPNSFSASLDHIVALFNGGNHTKENTQLAHLSCNIRKGKK